LRRACLGERPEAENNCKDFSNRKFRDQMNSSDETPPNLLSKIPKDLSSGLLYTHSRINANTSKNL
jgi:hypothetical protein